MKDLVMGVDFGTGGCRAVVYDLQGHELGFESTPFETLHPMPGRAEQRPSDWWDTFAKSVRGALEKAGADKNDIRGIALDSTCCTPVFCKEDGTPVRNAIMWMDVRASKEAAEISATKHPILSSDGGMTSPENMPCKVLWVKRNEPDIYASAEVICECQEWVTYKMTGKWMLSISNAGGRWYYDVENDCWPSLYDEIGLSDAVARFPKDKKWVCDYIGNLTPEAAEWLGLTTDVKVFEGVIDSFAGMIGLGVVDSSAMTLITGSSHLVIGFVKGNKYGEGYMGPMLGTLPDYGAVSAGQVSSGSIVSWFKDNFSAAAQAQADSEGVSLYKILDREAAKIEPGSEGLMVLDWWQGNRAPYTDPDVRGMIYGLSLNHTPYHVFRAIMEGIAYGTENNIQVMRRAGFEIKELVVCGGAAKSDLFLQIHADVSGLELKIPEVTETPALGGGIVSAVGIGAYKDLNEAVKNMVRYNKVVKPNMEAHEKYQKIFAQYEKAYPLMNGWMHEVSEL